MKNVRKNGKKIRILKILGLALIIFSIIIFAKNNFSNNNQQVFQASIIDNNLTKENIENIVISQNIPIPQELKDKMEKEQKAKEEKEKKEAEQKAKKEAEKKKKAEALKVAKAKTAVTSRGTNTTRQTSTKKSTTKKSTVTKNKKTTTTKKGKYITFNVSFYCPCRKCCGNYANGITASGKYAKANHTIAAPKGYSFGTKIYLEGMGTYTVEDRGGAIYGNRIDVYVNSHSEALKLGRKQIRGYVVND